MNSEKFDDSFKKIQRRYVSQLAVMRPMFANLAKMLSSGAHDPATIQESRDELHKLSGSAGTFGFPTLNSLSRESEALLDRLLESGPTPENIPVDTIDSFLIELDRITQTTPQDPVLPVATNYNNASVAARDFDFSIMVVDDDRIVRDLVVNELSAESCKITCFDNGNSLMAALEKTKKYNLLTKPDLILLDVSMPGLNGFQVLSRIKQDAILQTIPVMMLTREDEETSVKNAFSQGALDYIVKPFKTTSLSRRVMSFLRNDRQSVLIVDDDDLVADLLRHRFFLMGYNVLVARNGNDALSLLQSEKPDLVILDIILPFLDGLTVLKRAKANRATRHIPVVLLTEKAEKKHALIGFDNGAHDYITKPFDIDDLAARVASILRRHKLK